MHIYILVILILLGLVFVLWFKQNKQNQNTIFSEDQLKKIVESFEKLQQQQMIQATNQFISMFQAPKFRGMQGEKWLEAMLGQVLPANFFKMQYTFESKTICDAVVFLPNGKKLPIDSKFPKDIFQSLFEETNESKRQEIEKEFYRAIKLNIDDISRKYILPAEGTLDMALMYVPAENIYYHTFIEGKNELIDYAHKKGISIVSPNTLFLYLQFLRTGLQGHEIEKNARIFQQGLQAVINDLGLFYTEYKKLNEKLDQAQKNFKESKEYYLKIEDKLKHLHELPLSNMVLKKPE